MSKSQSGRTQNREQARQQAAALRDARLKKERRTRAIIVATVVAVVVGLVVVIALIVRESGRDELERVTSPSAATADAAIPIGQSGVAGVAEPADAPVVSVYSDYMCPVCGAFEAQHGAMLADLRDSGDLVVEYHPISILDRASEGTRYSTRSTAATAVVADGAPEQWLAFHDALFANQPQQGTGGLSDEQMAALAVQVGVPQAVADRIGSDTFTPWVRAATNHAGNNGVTGTPTVFIDGELWGGDWRVDGALEAALVEARG